MNFHSLGKTHCLASQIYFWNDANKGVPHKQKLVLMEEIASHPILTVKKKWQEVSTNLREVTSKLAKMRRKLI